MNVQFARVDYTQHLPEAFKGLYAASQRVHAGVLEPTLVELIFLRVSQLNGCAYCLDMHATALRKAGVEPRKLDTVAAWHDSRLFEPRERAALAWAEALTRLPSGEPDPALYETLHAHFDDAGIATLTVAVAVINAWNRLGVGLLPQMP
jgi:AhpD family alkylhydroperoxidase